jgi:hypothetical protein
MLGLWHLCWRRLGVLVFGNSLSFIEVEVDIEHWENMGCFYAETQMNKESMIGFV